MKPEGVVYYDVKYNKDSRRLLKSLSKIASWPEANNDCKHAHLAHTQKT